MGKKNSAYNCLHATAYPRCKLQRRRSPAGLAEDKKLIVVVTKHMLSPKAKKQLKYEGGVEEDKAAQHCHKPYEQVHRVHG